MKNMQPKQAVIYVRVSTGKQADQGASLDNQERACNEWALRNGVLARKLFREEGASAKTLKRPVMAEMLAFIDDNYKDIDFVIVYQMDRLARNMNDFVDFTRSMHEYGIEIRDSSSQMVSGESDELIQGVQALLAQHDNRLKSRRVTETMKRHASDGHRMHKAPYGLKNIRDEAGRPTVEPVPQIADNIAYLLAEYAKGMFNKGQMIQEARRIGLTQANGKEMSPQLLSKMLRQPLYAGLEKSKLTDGQIIPSSFEGIVPEWVYYTNQQLLESRKESKTEGYKVISAEYVLRKFVRCEACGKPLRGSASTGRSGKRYPRYHCTFKDCKSAHILPEELHEQYLELLTHIRTDENMQDFLKTMIVRVWRDEAKSMRQRRAKVRERIDKLAEERIDAAEGVVTRKITFEEKETLVNRISQNMTKLKAEAQKLDHLVGTKEEAIEYAIKYMGNAPRLWNNASPEMKVKFQYMIFPKGIPYNLQTNVFGTAEMSPLFTLAGIKKDSPVSDESMMVIPRGVEPRFPG